MEVIQHLLSLDLPEQTAALVLHPSEHMALPPRLQRDPPFPHNTAPLEEETDLIEFLHPAYAEPGNQLFALPRVDPVNGPVDSPDDARLGVHHLTALVACQIVANNAFDTGRLCLDPDGRTPAQESLHGVLVASKYYFVIDNDREHLFALLVLVLTPDR